MLYLLDASRLTSPGLVIGTVAYLAPEQLRGGEPAPASDIYSLGLVLLEALTGERAQPHGGGMAAALARLENPPTIPDSVDQRWAELLMHMMDLEASERPTAVEVATAASELTGPAAMAVEPPTETAVTVPLTAATLVAPVAFGDSPPVPFASAGSEQPARDRRSMRLVAIVGGALTAAAVAIVTILGISALGGPDQTPEPALTVPVDVGPSDAPPTG